MIFTGRNQVKRLFDSAHTGLDIIGLDSGIVRYVASAGVVHSITGGSNNYTVTVAFPYNAIRSNLKFVYKNLLASSVSINDTVYYGDPIGVQGPYGDTDYGHCHFEVVVDGSIVSPLDDARVKNVLGVYQEALYPKKVLNLTQGRHPIGSTSHMHLNAMDFDDAGTGDTTVYAPYDCYVVNCRSDLGQVCIESDPDLFIVDPKGNAGRQWMTLLHDHDLTSPINLYGCRDNRLLIKQGTAFYNDGRAGTDATHIHMECGRGAHPVRHPDAQLPQHSDATNHYHSTMAKWKGDKGEYTVREYDLSKNKIATPGAVFIEECLFVGSDVDARNTVDQGISWKAISQTQGHQHDCPCPNLPREYSVNYAFTRTSGHIVINNEGITSPGGGGGTDPGGGTTTEPPPFVPTSSTDCTVRMLGVYSGQQVNYYPSGSTEQNASGYLRPGRYAVDQYNESPESKFLRVYLAVSKNLTEERIAYKPFYISRDELKARTGEDGTEIPKRVKELPDLSNFDYAKTRVERSVWGEARRALEAAESEKQNAENRLATATAGRNQAQMELSNAQAAHNSAQEAERQARSRLNKSTADRIEAERALGDVSSAIEDVSTGLPAKFAQQMSTVIQPAVAKLSGNLSGPMASLKDTFERLKAEFTAKLNQLRCPVSGRVVAIEDLFMSLFGLHSDYALTANEYKALGLTANAYKNHGITAFDYATKAKMILI